MQKLVLILILAFASLYFAKIHPPIASTDSYFHLAIGREVTKTRQIPKVDKFTFVADGKQYIANEWLSGLIFYQVYEKWQEAGILALRALLGAGILFFLYKTLALLKIRFELIILFLLLNTFTLGLRMIDRPEIFSFLLFSLVLYVTVQSRKLLLVTAAPLIFLIWPNIQGYAPLGLLTLAYGLIRKDIPPRLSFPSRLTTFTLLASILAACFTIDQFKRFFYVFFLNRELFGYVVEVQSIFKKLAAIRYDFWASIPIEIYIFAIFGTISLISFRLRVNPPPESHSKIKPVIFLDLIYFLILAVLAVEFVRMIPLFILLSSPIIAQNLNYLPANFFWRLLEKAAISLLTLMVAVSIIQKGILGDHTNTLLVFDKEGKVVVATASTWKERQPKDALRFIKGNLAPKRLLTSLNWSNHVIWELPQTKTFGDIIYEKQTRQSLADLENLNRAQADWQNLLEKYQVDTVINTQPFNLVSFFEVPVWQLRDWSLVYADDVAVVWAKNAPSHLVLHAIHPQFASDFKFKEEEKDQAKRELEKLLSVSQDNSFAYEQLTLVHLLENEPELAQKRIKEAKSRFPKDPNFYLLEATLKASTKDCPGAAGSLKQAKKLATGYFYIQHKVEILAKRCGRL